MRVMFWLLLVAFAGLVAWLTYDFVTHRRTQSDVVEFEPNPESVAVYKLRVQELEVRYDSLSRRFSSTSLLRRPGVNARLMQLNEQIGQLKQAITAWETAKHSTDLYGKCILMYGRASGVCDALAADTLPATE